MYVQQKEFPQIGAAWGLRGQRMLVSRATFSGLWVRFCGMLSHIKPGAKEYKASKFRNPVLVVTLSSWQVFVH